MFTDTDLVESLRVLDPATWPSDFPESPTFGDASVDRLNDSLGLRDPQLRRKFREYVSGGAKDGTLIENLSQAVALIPTNSAECERGFHAMNLLMTSLRSSLHIPTLSDQLFIYITGPPLELFKPKVYVESWIRRGRHTATDSNAMTRRTQDHTKEHLYPVWNAL